MVFEISGVTAPSFAILLKLVQSHLLLQNWLSGNTTNLLNIGCFRTEPQLHVLEGLHLSQGLVSVALQTSYLQANTHYFNVAVERLD